VTSSYWSLAAWHNATLIRSWLREIWPTWRDEGVRLHLAADDNWYWVVPDFERGRSRIVGMPEGVLEQTTLGKFQQVLENSDGLKRMDEASLFVDRNSDEGWVVRECAPEVGERWYRLPGGEFFVAIPTESGGVAVGRPPPLPVRYLALHGETWSAMGPRNPCSLETYDLEDLIPYVPNYPRNRA
jgi:hypothetical protein